MFLHKYCHENFSKINPPDCLLYTSDAADERSSVDLGGRRIIKKKKKLYLSDDVTDTKKIINNNQRDETSTHRETNIYRKE